MVITKAKYICFILILYGLFPLSESLAVTDGKRSVTLKLLHNNIRMFAHDWAHYKALADAYDAIENYESSLFYYTLALDKLENSGSAQKGRKGLVKKMAKTYRRLGNYDAALYLYQLEIARDPEADWAIQKIGQWMLKYGNKKVGVRWLKRAANMQGSPDKAWRKLREYYQKKSVYRYIRFLREERDKFPYLAASWDRLISGLLEDARRLEAEHVTARALSLFQADSLWRTASTLQGRILMDHYEHKLNGTWFTAMGCGPYTQKDEVALKHYIKTEDTTSSSDFIIHLGDIGKGIEDVPESRYANMAAILNHENRKPTFVVLGDNDWNDTRNPAQSLNYWDRYLAKFYLNFDLPFSVETQPEREENFSFESEGVLYIGINLPEGKVHDDKEWRKRIGDNADWIQHSLSTNKVKAAVVMAHAPANVYGGLLLKSLNQSAFEFGRPLLFLHANGHKWKYSRDQRAPNIIHVQTNKLHDEAPYYPPVQIRYTGYNELPFVFDRRIQSPIWQLAEDASISRVKTL